MQTANQPENNNKSHDAHPSLGKAPDAKKPKNKCPSGRAEHQMEPEWKGRGFTHFKCKWCGKREAA